MKEGTEEKRLRMKERERMKNKKKKERKTWKEGKKNTIFLVTTALYYKSNIFPNQIDWHSFKGTRIAQY